MIKVLYILEDARFGGMSKMIVDLAAKIPSEKITSHILIGAKNSEYILQEINDQNIPNNKVKIDIISKNIKSIFLFLLFFVPDILRLFLQIKKIDPTIVYCNGSQHIKGVIAARLLKKKVIWHMHDTYQPKIILVVFNWIRFLFNVKHFAASSQRTAKFYNLPQKDTMLSIPPVDTSIFLPSVNRSFLGKSTINIISVANVNPDKGLDTLIRTVALVNEVRDDVLFKVVGLIPDTQKDLYNNLITLKNQLNIKNIEFTGQRSDIFSLLSEADLYLCTSNNESGPISVFEAMSMALPVVSTDVGDLKIIFAKNNSATVVPVKDHNSLAQAIISLLANPGNMIRLGQKGRLTAVEFLDIQISVREHRLFYNNLVNS